MKKFAYFIFSLIVLFHTSLEAKESVYYLHGFMRSSSSMKRMVKPFQNQGYKTYLWDYPSHRQTIEEHAKTLIQELQEATKQDPGLPIHFITHSLGGIILRAALNSPDCPEEAKKGNVVLLSPPNQGSSFARNLNNIGFVQKLFGKKAGKQLLTSQNFDHLGQFPETVDVLIISGTLGWNPFIKGKNDGKVGVFESCLATPHNHVSVPCGHSWIMLSKTVIDLALQFISH